MSRSFLEPLFWGDGVDELPVGGGVAFPVEVGLQIPGGADLSGPRR